jgi:hypothetical protein
MACALGAPARGAVKNLVDVTKPPYNAVGDGVTDCTAAINAALADAAKQSPKPIVYLPDGDFAHSNVLNDKGVVLEGSGPKTILRATVPAMSSVMLSGDGGGVKNLTVLSPNSKTRSSWSTSPAVTIIGATHFEISGLVVGLPDHTQGVEGAAIICQSEPSSDGLITGNTINNSMADAIHLTCGANHISVTHNTITGSGDDMVAVVSYFKDAMLCHDITIRDNDCLGQTGGRGITVIGGENVVIDHNRVENSMAAGIHLAAESSYMTYGPSNVTISNNVLRNCNKLSNMGHGSIFFYGNDLTYNGVRSFQPAKDIRVTGNTVYSSRCNAIRLGGYVDNVIVSGNVIDGADWDGIAINATEPGPPEKGATNVVVNGNTIRKANGNGIHVCGGTRGALTLTNNIIGDVGTSTTSRDAICIDGGADKITPLVIKGNKVSGSAESHMRNGLTCSISASAAATSEADILASNTFPAGAALVIKQ